MKGFKVNYASMKFKCICNNIVIYKYLLPKDLVDKANALTIENARDNIYYENLRCKVCGHILRIPRIR